MVLVKGGDDESLLASLQSVHLAMQLVVGLHAQGIVEVLAVVETQVTKHLCLLFLGNHVAETGHAKLFASYGVVRVEQHAPIFGTYNAAPAAVAHDKPAHAVNDKRIVVAFELDALRLDVAVRFRLQLATLQIQRDRSLVGFDAVVEEVESDFIGARDVLESDSRAMGDAYGFHGSGALVASSQDAVLAIDNDRLNYTELPQTLLQLDELILIQLTRVVVCRG